MPLGCVPQVAYCVALAMLECQHKCVQEQHVGKQVNDGALAFSVQPTMSPGGKPLRA